MESGLRMKSESVKGMAGVLAGKGSGGGVGLAAQAARMTTWRMELGIILPLTLTLSMLGLMLLGPMLELE